LAKSSGKGSGRRRGNPDEIVPHQFPKGVSGNPGGRPRMFRNYLRELVGEYGEAAYDIIWEIARGERKGKRYIPTRNGVEEVDAPPSISEQLGAAQFLAEQLNGKSASSLEMPEGTDSVEITINFKKDATA
jgi:hypothetical protein